MVGREGFVGVALAGGIGRSPHLALVQVASDAFRVRADRLQELLRSTPHLWTLLTRYALVLAMQLAQTAACNRLHDIEQRLSCLLLMSQDRLGCKVLPYTQELLSTMLGTDRSSVSLATAQLQRYGSIEQHRGEIKIADRSKLEASACECYAIIQDYSRELDENHA
jgi:CRP-like cAMP-binding protein